MSQQMWEERYSSPGRVWSGQVNPWLVEAAEPLPAGKAYDLGCGEGADSVWLAQHGWQVEAVDFSPSALRAGARAAQEAGVSDLLTWTEADLTRWEPMAPADLVLLHFLHAPEAVVSGVLQTAWRATGAGGTLLVIAHDPSNLTEGNGKGPQDQSVLYDSASILRALELTTQDPGVRVAERRRRSSAAGDWLDAIVIAEKST